MFGSRLRWLLAALRSVTVRSNTRRVGVSTSRVRSGQRSYGRSRRSDQMFWPKAIGIAVEGVDAASFLTKALKRDIFYNNDERFFRLQERCAH
jgi:hypothetical protein